jgi:LDH2 family malate/lactate/ureidoglycolate dehydrogenase
MAEGATRLVDPAKLRAFARAVYASTGVPEEDAALVADSLVQADLWGHQSHGVLRLDWYRQRLVKGAMKAATQPQVVVDSGALAVIDGHDGVGQVLADSAMREAIVRAKRHGIGAVGVRNSNHFGTAMYYTRRAPESACVGFLSTNASPSMAPWGGRRKVVGNNPWSIAAPAGRYPPMLLDIANTAVARGKIYLARQRGERIPAGWALDANGAATIDPQSAIDGIILPMAGHKGYGISVMMDVLSGVLTGSAFASGVHGPYQSERRSGCGHLAIAIDIEAFQPIADFHARMESMIAELKSTPLAPGHDEIHYPGELEARRAERNAAEGLDLPAETLADLERVARETRIPLDVFN